MNLFFGIQQAWLAQSVEHLTLKHIRSIKRLRVRAPHRAFFLLSSQQHLPFFIFFKLKLLDLNTITKIFEIRLLEHADRLFKGGAGPQRKLWRDLTEAIKTL